MDERGTILTVDDEPASRRLLVELLREQGWDSAEARDGEEAIKMVAEMDPAPALVLCDLKMPKMDGFGVLRVLSQAAPDLPVVVVTGSDDLNDAIQALKLGAWDYLVKPVEDPTLLEHAVMRCTERARLLAQNAAYREHLENTNQQLADSLARLQEDEEAGRRLQFSLLPPAHAAIGSLELSHKVFPSATLSGDFVDYFELGNGEIAFYIADVSGHGVSSAFVTALLKSFVSRAQAGLRRGTDPALADPSAFLSALNRWVIGLDLGKSVTVFYGLIDESRNRLRYANAGHFPYPVLSTNGVSRTLETHGFAVGHFDAADYETVEVTLPDQFRLFLASDGLFDVFEAPGVVAKEAMMRDLASKTHRLTGIVDVLEVTRREERPDHVTLLMVSREGT